MSIRDQQHQHALTLSHPSCWQLAFSRDSKWLATGTKNGESVRIWDAFGGGLVKELPFAGSAHVAFSPCQRWFVTGEGSYYRIWRTGSWEHYHSIATTLPGDDSPISFSPDGRLCAIADTPGRIKLIDTTHWTEIAQLDSSAMTSLAFSRDGTQLVAGARYSPIQIWDLQKVRHGLSTMGLDWNHPKLTSANGPPFEPLRIVVDDQLPRTIPLRISPNGGAFRAPVQVTLESGSGEIELHYSLDNSLPTKASPKYAGEFGIEKSAGLRVLRFDTSGPVGQSVNADFFIDAHAVPVGDSSWKTWDVTGERVKWRPSRWVVHGNTISQFSNISELGPDLSTANPDPLLRRSDTLRIHDSEKPFSDGTISLEMSSTDDDGIGIAFRLVDSQRYYLFAMNKEREFHVLARQDGDEYKVIAKNQRDFQVGRWHQVRITLEGPKVTVFVDGQKDLETTDSMFSKGTIALYSWGSDGVRFRNIKMTPTK